MSCASFFPGDLGAVGFISCHVVRFHRISFPLLPRSDASEQSLPPVCVPCCLQACFVLEHSDETMSQWSHPFRWVEKQSARRPLAWLYVERTKIRLHSPHSPLEPPSCEAGVPFGAQLLALSTVMSPASARLRQSASLNKALFPLPAFPDPRVYGVSNVVQQPLTASPGTFFS